MLRITPKLVRAPHVSYPYQEREDSFDLQLLAYDETKGRMQYNDSCRAARPIGKIQLFDKKRG